MAAGPEDRPWKVIEIVEWMDPERLLQSECALMVGLQA